MAKAKAKAKAKKSPARKAAKPAAKKAGPAFKDPLTKTGLYTTISESVGITKKDVANVFDALQDVIHRSIKPRSAQSFTLPGLLKIQVIRKPATKARKGINPFTGEPTVFKAKPARNVVKAKALKRLKEMAEN